MKIKNINKEINQLIRQGSKAPYDEVRYKYLKEIKGLFDNAIVLSYTVNLSNQEEIIEDDIKSYINLLDEDKSKQIVMIITSNGGDLTVVERIMTFIQNKYNKNIITIIPQIAMSAATIMSLSSKKIYMSEFSCLGPIDPQIRIGNHVMAGHHILATYEQCKNDLKANQNKDFWEIELKKYPPGVEKIAENGVKLSGQVASKFLENVMFENKDCQKNIDLLQEKLNSRSILAHNQKLLRDELSSFLKIENLEKNKKLYTAVINYHHAINITFERVSSITKIIETSDGNSMIRQRKVVNNNNPLPSQDNMKAPRQNIVVGPK